jgi:replicative superfamily II helicase
VAPLKALCTEKANDWKKKFEENHGLKCIEITGDTDVESVEENDLSSIKGSSIICTTPVRFI